MLDLHRLRLLQEFAARGSIARTAYATVALNHSARAKYRRASSGSVKAKTNITASE